MSKTTRISLIALATATVVAAVVGWYLWSTRPLHFYTDAAAIRQPVGRVAPRDVLWEPPRPLDELIQPLANAATAPSEEETSRGRPASMEAYEPRLSWDALTLFFVRGKAGGSADIHFTVRTPTGWTAPQPLDELNTPYDELGPEPSADGNAIYFYSDRPGGLGGYDLWVAHRAAPPANVFEAAASGSEFEPLAPRWQPPVNLGPAVNSEFNDYGPALARDGKLLVFSSNRPQPGDSRQPDPHAWPATVREDLFHRTYDLYAAAPGESGWLRAEALAALNTPQNEGAPCISPAGDFLYFASDRPGGLGGFDLYRSRRLRDAFQPAQNLGEPVNTARNELDPGLAQLGFALYFSSDREDVAAGVPAGRGPREGIPAEEGARTDSRTSAGRARTQYGLYYTSSREVFTESEARDADLTGLWNALWPNLLWLLLGLLLLALLLAFLRDMRNRKLSLLVRCLIASVAAHCLLLIATGFWRVAGALGEYARGQGGGSVRVTLAGAGGGDALTSQIRGGFTTTETPDAAVVAAPRETPALETRVETVVAALDVPRVAPHIAEPSRVEVPQRESAARAIERPRALQPEAIADPASVAISTPTESARIDAAEARPAHVAAQLSNAPRPANIADPGLAPDTSRAVAIEPSKSVTISDAPPGRTVDTTVASDAAAARVQRMRNDAFNADAPIITATLAIPAETGAPGGASGESESVAQVAPAALDSPGPPGAPIATSQPAGDPRFAALSPGRVDIGGSYGAAAGATNAVEARESTKGPSARPGEPTAPLDAAALPLGIPADALARGDGPPDAGTNGESGAMPAALGDIASARPSAPALSPGVTTPGFTRLPPAGVAAAAPKFGSPTGAAAARDAEPAPRVAMPGSGAAGSPGSLDVVGLPLGVPTETEAAPGDYAQRGEDQRRQFIERMGGSDETEAAVKRALAWLARHQSRDGHWDSTDFDERCEQCGGASEFEVDVATTGLALLAFLGANHTHVKDGPYRDNVQRALNWLVARVERNGDARAGETMYSQGIATIALAEACAMTKDSKLRPVVARAARFIADADDKRAGGWRYEPGQPGDTSVLGWQVMALRSAKSAGVSVPQEAFDSARRWLEQVESRTRPGLFAYRPKEKFTQAMTAEATFVRQLLGDPRDDQRMHNAIEFISRPPPDWERRLNTYSWYYVTLALFQHGGSAWNAWNKTLTKELLAHQRSGGKIEGSWDPGGEWAPVGGRVYQTAICALMLEVYYRYLPLYTLDGAPVAMKDGPDARSDFALAADATPIGTLRGRVTDQETGQPVEGATVRLDLEGDAVTTTTDEQGYYTLAVPRVPEFVAVAASREGYSPSAANVPGERLAGGASHDLDFSLTPAEAGLIALESEPDVHHLGNDRFEGAINSQFQKASEGVVYATEFEIPEGRLADAPSRVELRFLARGVQCPIVISINGIPLDERPNRSPRDGSFGPIRVRFESAILQEGTNTFELRDSNCTGDLDDIEFINVQIRVGSTNP